MNDKRNNIEIGTDEGVFHLVHRLAAAGTRITAMRQAFARQGIILTAEHAQRLLADPGTQQNPNNPW
jgi:hypothetical protein